MDIGINIADGVRVKVKDTLESLLTSLQRENIEYEVPRQIKNKDGSIDMIIFMRKSGMELNVKNNQITLIKSNNTKSNYIMSIADGMTIVEALNKIKENIAESFNIEKKLIRVNKFDGKSLDSDLSIPLGDNGEMVKIELIMGANQNIYIHSMELV